MGPTGVRPEGGPLSQENAGQRPRCPSPHLAGPGALSPCRHQHWPGLGAAKPQEEAGPSPESAHPRLLCSAQRQCRPLGGVRGLWERGQSVAVAARFPQPLRAPHHRAVGRRRQARPRTLQPAPDAAPVGRQCGRTLSPRGRRPARLAHGTLCRLAPGRSWLLPGRALFLSGVIGVSSPSPPGLRGL